MKTGIAASIKRLTAPEHRAAEAAVAAREPFASRERYAAYLCRLHAFYAAMEPALWLGSTERRKLPLIERDLDALGVARPAFDRTPTLPALTTRAQQLGVGYVLEGKTLGSRFLLEEARAKLGLGPDEGASFLAGYGAQTAAMWRSYLDSLTSFVAANGRRLTIVRSARATFASFTRWVA